MAKGRMLNRSQGLAVKEKQIENWLSANLHLIDPSLTLVKTQETVKILDSYGIWHGRFRRIDIHAVDNNDIDVLIEVKPHCIRAPWMLNQVREHIRLWPASSRGIIVGTDIALSALQEVESDPDLSFFHVGLGGVPVG